MKLFSRKSFLLILQNLGENFRTMSESLKNCYQECILRVWVRNNFEENCSISIFFWNLRGKFFGSFVKTAFCVALGIVLTNFILENSAVGAARVCKFRKKMSTC